MTGLSEEIRVFSKTLFNLGKSEGKLLDYGQEFESLISIFDEHPRFKALFFAPRISRLEKQSVLDRVFSGTFSKGFLSFLKVVILKRRQFLLEKIARDFRLLVDNDQGILRANIVSAVSLDKDSLSSIEGVLSKKFGKRVILDRLKVKPSILGGLVMEVEDTRIDLSVLHNLERLKDKILGIKLGGLV